MPTPTELLMQSAINPDHSACVAVQAMMYGYGDAQQPLPDSVDFVEVLPAPFAARECGHFLLMPYVARVHANALAAYDEHPVAHSALSTVLLRT